MRGTYFVTMHFVCMRNSRERTIKSVITPGQNCSVGNDNIVAFCSSLLLAFVSSLFDFVCWAWTHVHPNRSLTVSVARFIFVKLLNLFFLVQVYANPLGLFELSALCSLIHNFTRSAIIHRWTERLTLFAQLTYGLLSGHKPIFSPCFSQHKIGERKGIRDLAHNDVFITGFGLRYFMMCVEWLPPSEEQYESGYSSQNIAIAATIAVKYHDMNIWALNPLCLFIPDLNSNHRATGEAKLSRAHNSFGYTIM